MTRQNRSNSRSRRTEREPGVYKCVLCNRYHPLRFCRKFLKLTPAKREEIVDKYRYCVNCLAKTHDLRSCTSMDMCKKCDRFHHTLLHPKQRYRRSTSTTTTQQRQKPQNQRQTPRKQRNRERPSATNPSPTTSSVTPNTQVLVEAIRSLATVLCANATK